MTEAAGAPPFYLAALVTRDNGQTWAPIPVPHGSGPAGFGGFRYAGATLEAVFAASLQGYPRAYPEFSATRAATEVSRRGRAVVAPGAARLPARRTLRHLRPLPAGQLRHEREHADAAALTRRWRRLGDV